MDYQEPDRYVVIDLSRDPRLAYRIEQLQRASAELRERQAVEREERLEERVIRLVVLRNNLRRK